MKAIKQIERRICVNRWWVLLVALCGLQNTSAVMSTIEGVVSDETGAVIVNARVELKTEPSSEAPYYFAPVTTDNQGRYVARIEIPETEAWWIAVRALKPNANIPSRAEWVLLLPGATETRNLTSVAGTYEVVEVTGFGQFPVLPERSAVNVDGRRIVGTGLVRIGGQFRNHPFVWRDGVIADLAPAAFYAISRDINSWASIVGTIMPAPNISEAFYYSTDEQRVITLPALGGNQAQAIGINDWGAIVGRDADPNGAQVGLLWPSFGDQPINLNVRNQGRYVNPVKIASDFPKQTLAGEADLVVGGMVRRMAFTYTEMDQTFVPIGPEGFTRVRDINSRGRVVGHVNDVPTERPAGFEVNDRWYDFGVLLNHTFGRVEAINELDIMVGRSTRRQGMMDVEKSAVMWDSYEVGFITKLDELLSANSNWVLEVATHIDRCGVIIGIGKLNNQPKGFSLSPPAAMRSC